MLTLEYDLFMSPLIRVSGMIHSRIERKGEKRNVRS
jgi:hypothetical protein